jgi:hypothetical protein
MRATRVQAKGLLRRHTYRYDALLTDGSVILGVTADQILQGRRFPADASATRVAAERASGDEGPGAWVEYTTGRRLE